MIPCTCRLSESGSLIVTGDGGFQGGRDGIPSGALRTPHKKPPRGRLSKAKKAYNRWSSSARSVVERFFARLKKFRIMKAPYWKKADYDAHNDDFAKVAGLINFVILWVCKGRRMACPRDIK